LKFKDKKILLRAFTHSSASQKNSNERLEFLGDAVLELITREYLYAKFPDADEGKLSKLKKSYTNGKSLYAIGKSMGLGEFLLMNKGEELTGGRERKSNIANCLEAVIGAVYLDRGLKTAREFVNRFIFKAKVKKVLDYKSLINEWAIKRPQKIVYRLIKEEGPPHKKLFSIGLYIGGKRMEVGLGSSKKEAEQNAAQKFWEEMNDVI
jgi:ribonuclease-3